MPAPPPPLHLSSQYGPYGVSSYRRKSANPVSQRVSASAAAAAKSRGRRAIVAILVIILMGSGAWLVVEHRDDVVAISSRAAVALQEFQSARSTPAPGADAVKTVEPLPVAEREIAPIRTVPDEDPAASARASVEDLAPEVEPPAQTPGQTAQRERLANVTADPTDRLQQRALAAGLHPGLSRTLLDRLSAEDFRNAAHAVQGVLSGTSASPFVWPRRQQPQRAQFRVRLVNGAPADCRRYVVQIAKDGWETTAQPMERCEARQALKP